MVAMVAFLDEGVKNVTDALKAKKDPSNPGATLWDNTIVIFSAGE
jgi:arylsulfatase A-like enzyme